MWLKPGDEQASLSLLCFGLAPMTKARSSNRDRPTCPADITVLVGMLPNLKFALHLSLIACH